MKEKEKGRKTLPIKLGHNIFLYIILSLFKWFLQTYLDVSQVHTWTPIKGEKNKIN